MNSAATEDGGAKSPIYFVVAGREMLDVPGARLRFRNTTTPRISNFCLAKQRVQPNFCKSITDG